MSKENNQRLFIRIGEEPSKEEANPGGKITLIANSEDKSKKIQNRRKGKKKRNSIH